MRDPGGWHCGKAGGGSSGLIGFDRAEASRQALTVSTDEHCAIVRAGSTLAAWPRRRVSSMFTRTGPCTPRPFTTATSVGVTAAPGNGAAGMSALAYGTAHTVLRAKQGQCRFGPTQCFGSAAAAWRDPHREDLPRARSAGSRGDSHGRSAVLGCEAADPAVGIASLARRSAFRGSRWS